MNVITPKHYISLPRLKKSTTSFNHIQIRKYLISSFMPRIKQNVKSQRRTTPLSIAL
nr:MAG TPA: hypothetical protein [Caudoviricetes sp.]